MCRHHERSRSALGRRSRGLVLAWVVGGMLLGPSLACGDEEAAPITTARAFAATVQAGDAKRMLGLLDERARAHLQRAAHRASDQVGGRRNIDPHEMLQIVDVDPRFQVAQAELIIADDETARVRLTGVDGVEHDLTLVHEDGAWKVSLALPAAPPVAEP